MTRTSKVLTYALAGLAGLCHSQKTKVTVTLDGDGKNLEYNSAQTFTCKWNSDELLSGLDLDLTTEPLQIKWYWNGNTIYTMQAESYIPYPNFGTTFTGRETAEAAANVTVSQSTLTLSQVELEDLGAYKCRVSLRDPIEDVNGKMGYVSGNGEMSDIKVYAKPNVTFTEVTTLFDTRAEQYATYIANLPVENANTTTEVTDGSIDSEINSENEIPADDESSEESSSESSRRKRRQADEETANPEIEAVDPQQQIAKCEVKGAYPEPASIKIKIGDTEISSLDSSQFVIINSGKLYDTSVTASAVINGAEQDGQTVKCIVSDADSMYSVEAESEALDIKYLPTQVSVEASSDMVYESDTLIISCKSNGNPAPSLQLVHLSDETVNAAIGNSSEYTISSVEQEGDYNFKCIATSPEFEKWSKESDPLQITVNYLDKPYITIDGNKNKVDAKNSVEVGKDFTLECEAEANPAATYKWYKNGEDYDISNNELKIVQAKWTDSGDYHCTAENGSPLGSLKSNIAKIEVQGGCDVQRIVVLEPKAPGKDGKQSVTLDCQIDEKVQPKCNIKWVYPKGDFTAKQAGSQLTIININEVKDDVLFETQFACQATNDFDPNTGDSSVLKGSEVSKKLSADSGGIPWMWIGIGALVLVIAVVVFNKRKNSNEAPEEESQKMNA